MGEEVQPMIRAAIPSDESFVTSTWVKSMLSTGKAHKMVGHAQRRHGQDRGIGAPLGQLLNDRVDLILDRKTCRCLVTAWDKHPDVILGWMVYEPGVIHYIWVRKEERGHRIATKMLRHAGITATEPVQCTSIGPDSEIMRRSYGASRYLPFEELK